MDQNKDHSQKPSLEDMYDQLQNEIIETKKQMLQKYPTVDDYFEKVYGIKSIMDFDFPDLYESNEDDFIYDHVRGNPRLKDEIILTYKESNDIVERALNLKLEF